MKISISNYRNISAERPLTFEIKEGVTFVLGINNIGKSNLLKFFYDFKPAWYQIIQRLDAHHFQFDDIGIEFNSTETFDHLINQNSKNNEIIKCEIFHRNTHIKIDLFVIGKDWHTNKCSCKVSYSKVDSSRLEVQPKLIFDFMYNMFYIGSFRSGLSNSNGHNYDIQVGSNFVNQWNHWSAGKEIYKTKKIASLISELKELFGYSNFDIKVNQDTNGLLIINDDGVFQLNELGDGIAHFIIVLANVLIRNPSFVLIDEPEIGLHPKMQELFIRTLSTKTKNGILATSHSIALARSSADHIYSLTKSTEGKLNLLPFGEHFKPTISQTINEMGYSQYAELGGNNILLVEGRTDIKAFREILRKFDLEKYFIVLSFGGSQFTVRDKSKIVEELSELKRLNTNVFVVFDSEKENENDKLRQELKIFNETCIELGFSTFATEGHSSDNYISQASVDKVLGNSEIALSKYENPKRWEAKKEKNWLMFREMNKNDFDNTELKTFIETILIPATQKKVKYMATEVA